MREISKKIKGSTYAINIITAVNYPRVQNLVPNQYLDIVFLPYGRILKSFNLNIHEF